MNAERAMAVLDALRELLQAETARVHEERRHLRALDAEELFARVAARARFIAEARQLGDELARALEQAALALGTAAPTIEEIARVAPREGRRLAAAAEEVKALARGLAGLNDTNRVLAKRALACVRGYLTALAPRAAAYDCRGTPAAAGAAVYLSRRA